MIKSNSKIRKYSNQKRNALLLSLLFIIVFVILLVGGAMLLSMLGVKSYYFFYGCIGTLMGVFAIIIFMKYENMPISSIKLFLEQYPIKKFLIGTAIGIGLFATIVMALIAFGNMRLDWYPSIDPKAVMIALLPVFPLALMEEIGFRSYPFFKLKKAFGIWPTQLIIALAFAVYHVLNGWEVGIAFLGPGIWAFVFGLAAMWSNGIAMPTGIHFAINIMQNLGGFKQNKAAVFHVLPIDAANKQAQISSNTIGLLMQLLILIAVLILMYAYDHKKIRC